MIQIDNVTRKYGSFKAIVTIPRSDFELESGVDKWLDTSLAMQRDDEQVQYLFAQGPGDFSVLKLSDRDLYLKLHSLPVEALRKMTREKLLEPAQPEEPSVE